MSVIHLGIFHCLIYAANSYLQAQNSLLDYARRNRWMDTQFEKTLKIVPWVLTLGITPSSASFNDCAYINSITANL